MSAKPPRTNHWIWYFVIVAILGAIAAAIPLVYNLRQQLTLPALQAARAKWRQNGPKSYVMEYDSKQGRSVSRFIVSVRDGKVESVLMKSSENDPGRPLEPRQFGYHDMLGIFDSIERFLEMDAEPNAPSAFNLANFDAADGHLLRYVRSVSTRGDAPVRLEIRVEKLTPQ